MAKHTPGPWASVERGTYEEGPTEYRIVVPGLAGYIAGGIDYSPEGHANALLIAAAPALLAAAKKVKAADPFGSSGVRQVYPPVSGIQEALIELYEAMEGAES